MTLARLQQLTTLTLLCAATAWAAYFVHGGRYVAAAGGAALIVFGYALFLAVEFVVLGFVAADDPAPRARIGQLVRAWWGEVVTAPIVFCWRQPFRSRAEPDHLPPGTSRPGAVFVHGFVCNRGLWNPWMRRLRADGTPFMAVDLAPVFGSIDQYADIIDDAVRRITAATGQPPIIVAHSMGGIATRAWLARDRNAGRVARVVTIGTPHAGTWLARFGHTTNGRQMRIGNPWLRELCEREAAASADGLACVPPSLFVCYYSNCDNIVMPPSTAALPGADNRLVPGVAHVQLAFVPVVVTGVMVLLSPAVKLPSGP